MSGEEIQRKEFEPVKIEEVGEIELVQRRFNYIWMAIFSVVLAILGAGLYFYFNFPIAQQMVDDSGLKDIFNGGEQDTSKTIKKFVSDEEFRQYLKDAQSAMGSSGFIGRGMEVLVNERMAIGAVEDAVGMAGSVAPSRVSDTNVQVKGIDEPDIVKTNGKEIFVSQAGYDFVRPMLMDQEIDRVNPGAISDSLIYPGPEYLKAGTKVVHAYPPAELQIQNRIEESGDLLLQNENLVIFSGQKLVGYNVSNPAVPEKMWTYSMTDNTSVVASRLKDDKIYLVLRTFADVSSPCPMPLMSSGSVVEVKCTDIYHPVEASLMDSTFSVVRLNPSNGEVVDKMSFVGNSSLSSVYMSENNIFISYAKVGDYVDFMFNFYNDKGRDLMANEYVNRLGRLRDIEISSQAKLTELGVIMNGFLQGLSGDERRRVENEMANRMSDYLNDHGRELERSGIIKVDNESLAILAHGEVAGTVLNQFSMDEQDGFLRIATTISNRSMFGSGESVNDVYVLNQNMEVVGEVMNLGLGERVYSARFIGDRGYVVTFKQIDPFYVLNMSEPTDPKMAGELKIPGFSSYLHPLKEDVILGVGNEDGQVKLSLFDVFNATEPKEVDKYKLDDYWTEVSSTHQAFLHDTKHEVFFMPGSKGGYVFSYLNDKLELKTVIADITAKRAVFIDDFLYIIGERQIVVLDENDWSRTNALNMD